MAVVHIAHRMNTETPARRATATALAVIGFLALVILGLWLAVWAARSLSGGAFSLGAAADYVGSMFTPKGNPSLTVVSTSSAPLPFGSSTPTSTVTATTTPHATTTPAKKTSSGTYAPVQYRTVETTYPTPGATPIAAPAQPLSGFPDIQLTVTAVGYFDASGAFIASSTISHSATLGAEILVANTGTNVTGPWDITVTVPTVTNATFSTTQTMASLNPHDKNYIDVRLTTGQARIGTDTITAVADPNNKITETSETNNSSSATITVQ